MTLVEALAAADWRVALDRAIARWRETRAVELATLVDRIAARCAIPPPPAHDLHAWWMAHALAPYDPAVVTTLVEHAATRLGHSDVAWATVRARWPDDPLVLACQALPSELRDASMMAGLNWLDRLLAIARWPDDPRLGPLLAGWLARGVIVFPAVATLATATVMARLASLGDRRVLPPLRAMTGTESLVVALEAFASPAVEPAIALWNERLAVASERERLWAAVAMEPGSLEPRAVLADALAELGDDRGELIALQLANDGHPDAEQRQRVDPLVLASWDRWMGELATVLVQERCVFRAGMLASIAVGKFGTSPANWRAVVGHRELACVEAVVPQTVLDPAGYAAFLCGLPCLRALQLAEIAFARALAACGAHLPIVRLDYRRAPGHSIVDPHAAALAAIAPIAPDVVEVVLDGETVGRQLAEIASLLPTLFPALAAIAIVPPLAWPRGLDRARLASLPYVTIRG